MAKLAAPSMLPDDLSPSDMVLVWKSHRILGIMGPLTHPEVEFGMKEQESFMFHSNR